MNRRSFLKILGVASFAIALPPGIEHLIKQVERSNYDKDLLQHMFGDILNAISPEEFEWLNNLNETYSIYQIEGKRVKISNNINRKDRREKLKSVDWKLLETSNNIFDATIRQTQYNIELGKKLTGKFAQAYGQPYFWVRVRQYRSKTENAQSKRVAKYDWEAASLRNRKLTKGEVFKLKDRYLKDQSLSVTELGLMFGIGASVCSNYLQNKMKVNHGPKIKLRKQSISKCKYCKRIIESESNFKRWHGENCKKSPNYSPSEYKTYDHYPKWLECSTGFSGTYYEIRAKFPHINMPSMMNSNRLNKALERGKNKGLQFKKL